MFLQSVTIARTAVWLTITLGGGGGVRKLGKGANENVTPDVPMMFTVFVLQVLVIPAFKFSDSSPVVEYPANKPRLLEMLGDNVISLCG